MCLSCPKLGKVAVSLTNYSTLCSALVTAPHISFWRESSACINTLNRDSEWHNPMLISTVSTWNTKAMRRLFKNSITYNIVDFVLCCLKLQSLVLTLVVSIDTVFLVRYYFPRPLVPSAPGTNRRICFQIRLQRDHAWITFFPLSNNLRYPL